MHHPNASAVILAAGLSTRLGGRLKALLPLHGKTLLERITSAVKDGGIQNILVVTGHQDAECGQLAESLGAVPVYNKNFASGMFSSTQAGLKAALEKFPASEAVLFSPVDAALVMPRSVSAMLAAWEEQKNGPFPGRIIVASFNGRTGHPVLLPACHIPEILKRPESGEPAPWQDPDAPLGLRGYYHDIIDRHGACQMENFINFLHPVPEAALSSQRLISIPLPDAGIRSDIDTEKNAESAASFIAATEHRTIPSVEEAWQLLNLSLLSPKKLRHSILVALGSLRIGLKMAERGLPHNPLLLIGAGLLHDVLRMKSEHAVQGANLLHKLGWAKTSFVVGCHTRLPHEYFKRIGINTDDKKFKSMEIPAYAKNGGGPGEELFYSAVAVYMADKYARRDKMSTIAERFKDIRDWFRDNPDIIEGIDERERVVNEMEKWLENLLGCNLLELVSTPSGHPLEAALNRVIDGSC